MNKIFLQISHLQKKSFLIFIFLILTVVSGYTQSLQQVVQMAMQNNPRLKAWEQQVSRAELEAKATFRETLPSLNLDASYNHVTDVPEIQMPAIGMFPGSTIRMGTYDKYETGLSANYVLFAGFALKNKVTLKKQEQQIQEIGFVNLKKEIAFQTIAVYKQIQATDVEKQILSAAKKRINLQLKRTCSLVQQGMTLALDTLSLNLALLDYEKKMLKVRSELKTGKQQLKNLVGETIQVSSEIPRLSQETLPEWDRNKNTEIRTLKMRKKMAETITLISRAAYYPQVAIQAAYRYGKPGLDVISNEWMHYGVWGIGLNWNLFKGQADQLRSDAAKAEAKRISYIQTAVNDQLYLTYNQALNEYEFLIKQYAVLEQALDISTQKMKIVKIRYEQGMASVTDYNTVNLQLTEAELSCSRLLLQISLKLNEIEYKSGKPIIDWSLTQ